MSKNERLIVEGWVCLLTRVLCQLRYSWNLPNPKLLGVRVRDFLDRVIPGGKTHPP